MELFDDYTKATFPLEITWGGHGTVRLLAAFNDRVVGASYHRDRNGTEYLSQSLDWDGQGKFGGGLHPEMDLPPPPAKVNELADELYPQAAGIWCAEDRHRLASTRDAHLRRFGMLVERRAAA